ncbi:hypothetical protein [Microbacterium maritypicum]
MTDTFTASNGITIREREDTTPVLEWNADGRYCTDGSRWYAVGEGIDGADPGFTADSPVARALRELWQRERDEELGRWRWPENPDYVVYSNDPVARLRVVRESDGFVALLDEATDDAGYSFQEAARAYFEAHPERKAWDDANPGEVWVVKEHGQPERAYMVDDTQFYDSSRDYALNFDDSVITDARRIWPEDAS